jgi:hypothetical protein
MDVSEFVVAALLLELTPGPHGIPRDVIAHARAGSRLGRNYRSRVRTCSARHLCSTRRGSADPAVRSDLRGPSMDRRCLSLVPRLGRLANPSGNLAGPR